MSKVFQCDRCKAIYEHKTRVLQNGELFLARNNMGAVDLCPICYQMLTDFLNSEVENKCKTCRFKAHMSIEPPCNECCYSHDSCYEKEDDDD